MPLSATLFERKLLPSLDALDIQNMLTSILLIDKNDMKFIGYHRFTSEAFFLWNFLRSMVHVKLFLQIGHQGVYTFTYLSAQTLVHSSWFRPSHFCISTTSPANSNRQSIMRHGNNASSFGAPSAACRRLGANKHGKQKRSISCYRGYKLQSKVVSLSRLRQRNFLGTSFFTLSAILSVS